MFFYVSSCNWPSRFYRCWQNTKYKIQNVKCFSTSLFSVSTSCCSSWPAPAPCRAHSVVTASFNFLASCWGCCCCCCCCCCCSWWWCWLFLWGRAQGTVTASLNLFTSCRIEDCKEILASWGSWLWLWWWGLQAGLMIAKNKMAAKYEMRNTKYNLPVYGDAGCGFLCQVEQRFLVNCSPSDGNDGQWWWWWW